MKIEIKVHKEIMLNLSELEATCLLYILKNLELPDTRDQAEPARLLTTLLNNSLNPSPSPGKPFDHCVP